MKDRQLPPQIKVIYQAEQDLPSWIHRSALDEVPSRWPYGLHELSAWPALVSAASVAQPGTISKVVARTVPASARARLARGSGGRQIGITWDENAARRMLMLKPHREMFTGVIWLTDTLAADPSSCVGLVRTLRQMDGLWVLNRPQVTALKDVLGTDGPPVSFVAFGVDATFFAPQSYPDKPMVLSVGSDRHRDPETLFAALRLVHASRPDAEILVQTRSDLPAPAGVTKISAVPHSELRKLYARSSVVAVATRPNLHASGMTVMLEAMATARPVVITHTVGLEDYLSEGQTGLFSRPEDPQDLSERILELLNDAPRAAEMGRHGREVLEAKFTTSHMAHRIAKLMSLNGPATQALPAAL
jgi:glycosyltransferase involved in cell wall biosynthesis